MDEKNEVNNELPDSISWGSASKGASKKVYGDLDKAPVEFGRKIERMKIAEKFALGELDYEQYKTAMGLIK